MNVPPVFRTLPRPRPPDRAKFDAVCFGYNSIDYLCLLPDFPERGKKMLMQELALMGGGQSGTAAATLSGMGFSARYLGKFGDDEMGGLSKKSLNAGRVDTSRCLTAAGCRNQTAIIWVERVSGERTITYIRDKGLDVLPGDFAAEDVSCGRILMADAHCIAATTQAARAARKAGMPVLLDVEKVFDDTSVLLAEGDYLLCDGSFPVAFTGRSDPYEALAELDRLFPNKVLATTMGAQGSLAYFQGEYLRTPGFIVNAVDTTGAGDVFHAGFAAGLLAGCDLFACFEMANAAAALACTRLGARAALCSLEEAKAFAASGPRRDIMERSA